MTRTPLIFFSVGPEKAVLKPRGGISALTLQYNEIIRRLNSGEVLFVGNRGEHQMRSTFRTRNFHAHITSAAENGVEGVYVWI